MKKKKQLVETAYEVLFFFLPVEISQKRYYSSTEWANDNIQYP